MPQRPSSRSTPRWASLTDQHEFYGSRGADAKLNRRMTELMDSVAKFGAGDGLDVVPSSRYLWTL